MEKKIYNLLTDDHEIQKGLHDIQLLNYEDQQHAAFLYATLLAVPNEITNNKNPLELYDYLKDEFIPKQKIVFLNYIYEKMPKDKKQKSQNIQKSKNIARSQNIQTIDKNIYKNIPRSNNENNKTKNILVEPNLSTHFENNPYANYSDKKFHTNNYLDMARKAERIRMTKDKLDQHNKDMD